MLLSPLLLALGLVPLAAAAPAPNPDLMDFWPTNLVPTGTELATRTYVFNFPFPTTVTRTFGAAASPTGTAPAASGTGTTSAAAAAAGTTQAAGTTAQAAKANAAPAIPSLPPGLLPGMLDPGAMAGAFQAQADALLREVKKQTITIVCAILFGTLGGLALIAGLIWCLRRRKRRNAVKRSPAATRMPTRMPVQLDDRSEVSTISGRDEKGLPLERSHIV